MFQFGPLVSPRFTWLRELVWFPVGVITVTSRLGWWLIRLTESFGARLAGRGWSVFGGLTVFRFDKGSTDFCELVLISGVLGRRRRVDCLVDSFFLIASETLCLFRSEVFSPRFKESAEERRIKSDVWDLERDVFSELNDSREESSRIRFGVLFGSSYLAGLSIFI